MNISVNGNFYEIGENGCGDNSCMIKKPNGMGTNGGCRCFSHIRNTADKLEAKKIVHNIFKKDC